MKSNEFPIAKKPFGFFSQPGHPRGAETAEPATKFPKLRLKARQLNIFTARFAY